MFALVRRDLINFSMGRPKEPVTLEDLVPDLPGSKPVRRPRMTEKRRQRIAASFRAYFGTGASGAPDLQQTS